MCYYSQNYMQSSQDFDLIRKIKRQHLHSKPFYSRNYFHIVKSYSVCHCQSLPPQSNVGEVRSSMTVVPLVCIFMYVSVTVTVTNTLAYYNPEFITTVISLQAQAPSPWSLIFEQQRKIKNGPITVNHLIRRAQGFNDRIVSGHFTECDLKDNRS